MESVTKMSTKDLQLVRDLIKTRKEVKDKFDRFKNNMALAEEEQAGYFKPLTGPLKEMVNVLTDKNSTKTPQLSPLKMSYSPEQNSKLKYTPILPSAKISSPMLTPVRTPAQNSNKKVDYADIATSAKIESPTLAPLSTPAQNSNKKVYYTTSAEINSPMSAKLFSTELTPTNPLEESFEEEEEEKQIGDMEYVSEGQIDPLQLLKPIVREKTVLFKQKLGDIAGPWVKKFLETGKRSIDTTYGFKVLEEGGLGIGDKPISIENNDIIIGDIPFKGTEGLYNLIVEKEPLSSSYTAEDLSNYKRIVLLTKVHLKSNNKIKSNSGYKYTYIIKPMFSLKPSVNKTPGKIADKVGGTYWNDPNELIRRLRLIHSSQAAGNTSKENYNESVDIIQELARNQYIYV